MGIGFGDRSYSASTWIALRSWLAQFHHRSAPPVPHDLRSIEWPPEVHQGFEGLVEDEVTAARCRELVAAEPLYILTANLFDQFGDVFIPGEFESALAARLREIIIAPAGDGQQESGFQSILRALIEHIDTSQGRGFRIG